MALVRHSTNRSVFLQIGEVLTVDAGDGVGSVVRQALPLNSGQPYPPVAYTGSVLTFGPYDVQAAFTVYSTSGGIVYNVAPASAKYEPTYTKSLDAMQTSTLVVPANSTANITGSGIGGLVPIGNTSEPGTPIQYTGTPVTIDPVATRRWYRIYCLSGTILATTGWISGVGAAVPDTTAPTLSAPTGTQTGQTTATVGVTTNEAGGTLYFFVSNSATPPAAAALKAGTGAVTSGSQVVSATGAQSVNLVGLTASTTYYTHWLHRDAAGNDSAIVSGTGFTTAAAVPALGNLTLSGTLTNGTASSGTIIGATTSSTITSNVTGLTVNSGARTYSWDGTGAAGTTANGLVETLAGATGSPKNNSVTVAAAAGPTLFAFNDNFSTDGPIRSRTGWSGWGDDWRDRDAIRALTGLGGKSGTSFASKFVGLVDVGRTDAQYAEVVTGTGGLFEIVARVSDENNYVYFRATGTQVSLRRVVAGTNTTFFSTNRTPAAGDIWRIEIAGNTAILFVNGARWPNGTTSYDVSAVPLGSRAGFHNANASVSVDSISVGYGASALPRVGLDPVRRFFQRGATSGTCPAFAISGACSGATALEIRVENAAGAALTGWDWGQKQLVNASVGSSFYTATVPAGVSTGEGTKVRIRATNDTSAQSASNPFAVGDIFLVYGQSNGAGLTSGGGTLTAASGTFAFTNVTGATTAYSTDENFSAGGLLTDTPQGFIANTYNTAAGVPVAIVNRSISAMPMSALRPSSATLQGSSGVNAWTLLTGYLAAVGNDCAGFVMVHGESDAGSVLNTTVASFSAATYKSGLDEMYASLKTITGRTAAQLPFMMTALGRLSNGSTGETFGPNWAAVRLAQYEWCRDTTGGAMIAANFDVAMNTGQDPAWHYSGGVGYPEAGKRIGAGMGRVKGATATDRRGALPTGITRSGSTIILTLSANGTTGLTFAAGTVSPTNFVFGTTNAFTTPLTPTSFTIDSATQVTFTFGGAVPAGAAVRVTQAQNPDVPNFLFSTYTDGSVMTFPVFDVLVAA